MEIYFSFKINIYVGYICFYKQNKHRRRCRKRCHKSDIVDTMADLYDKLPKFMIHNSLTLSPQIKNKIPSTFQINTLRSVTLTPYI